MQLGLEERGVGTPLAGDRERLLGRVDPGDERAERDQLGRHLAGAAGRCRTCLPLTSGSRSRTASGSRARSASRACAVALVPRCPVLLSRPHLGVSQIRAHTTSEKPPSTTSGLAADHLGARASRGRRRRRRRRRGSTSRPAGVRARLPASICSRFGKWSSAPVSTTPPETALTRIPRGRELDREVADERLERRLRRADEDVVLEHARRAEARDRDDRRAGRHLRRGRPGEREERARVRGERPVEVLVGGLERRADDAGRGAVDERVERAERGDLVGDAGRGDVAADEHRLGAEPAQLLGGLLGGGVVAQVADRDPLRPVLGEASCDLPPDSARAARDQDGAALGLTSRVGSGLVRAAPSSGSAPSPAGSATRAAPRRPSTTRGRGGRAAPSSPRRSRRTGLSSGRSRTSSSTRARIW